MDRIRFGAIILLVFCAAFWTCEASASKLKVPAEGEYLYWVNYTDADGKPQTTSPEKFKGKTLDLDLSQLGGNFSGAEITVLDLETGNTAVKPIAQEKESKDLVLTADDFRFVRNVEIRITSKDGKPIESAVVTLTDADNKPMTRVIDPTSLGTAAFNDVASGEVTVAAVYEGRKKTWDVEVPLDRESALFSKDLKIAGKVSTVSMAETTQKAQSEKAGPDGSKVKVYANYGPMLLLNTLLGLLLLTVIIVAVVMFLRAKGLTAAASLKKLGVQMPEGEEQSSPSSPEGAPSAPQTDPTVCPFCGQKKDAAGNCACSVTGAPSAAGTASGVGEPRLIGTQGTYAGTIFPLATDVISIGREETNSVALPLDTTTSRHHATISRSNGSFTIRDEGSSNGTFVNGAKIMAAQPLRPGDEVQIGSSKFRFEVS